MIYLDASFVVSLHFRDANSAAALALIESASAPLAISSLGEVETVNAFSLRVFRKEMSAANMAQAVRDLDADLRNGVLQRCSFPESAFLRARTLAQSLTPLIGVRSEDLLHVAAALELGAEGFFTFDQKQHKAAQSAGLTVNQLA